MMPGDVFHLFRGPLESILAHPGDPWGAVGEPWVRQRVQTSIFDPKIIKIQIICNKNLRKLQQKTNKQATNNQRQATSNKQESRHSGGYGRRPLDIYIYIYVYVTYIYIYIYPKKISILFRCFMCYYYLFISLSLYIYIYF